MANGATRKLRNRWLVIALILAAAAAYAGLERPWETKPIAVAVEILVSGPVSQVLAVNGRIAARTSVTVRAAVSAQALSFHADEGEHVTAGQVLLMLDTAIIDVQVEQATAALESQQALQRQARATVDRARALGPNSPRSVLEDAEFRLTSIQQETARLEAALRQVQRQLAQFTVRSPMTGVVVTRGVNLGQLVDLQTELFVIADVGDLVVETDVDELYSAYMRDGLKVLLKPVGTSIVRGGRVVFTAPTVDSSTGGREIKIAFDEKVSLPVGLTINANLIVNEVENALSLPRRAIVIDGGQSHVLVLENGVAVQREIGFSDWPSERVIVTEGLREGEAVILDPAALTPGDRAAPE